MGFYEEASKGTPPPWRWLRPREYARDAAHMPMPRGNEWIYAEYDAE